MSTLAARPRRAGAAVLAIVTSFLVVLSGMFVAPAAHAVPTPTLQVTEAPREGGTVTVTGSGFAYESEGDGVYVGLGSSAFPSFYRGSMSDTVWVAPGNSVDNTPGHRSAPMNSDGSFSITFEVPAIADGVSYALYSSIAHGGGITDPSQDVKVGVSYSAPAAIGTAVTLTPSAAEVSVGDEVTLTATVSPAEAAGSVAFLNGATQIGDAQPVGGGVATLSTSALPVGTHSLTATFTPASGDFLASTSAAASVTVTSANEVPPVDPPVSEPTIAASVTDASEEGITFSATVQNIVLRAAADVSDTGKDDQGVYIALIEKDLVSELGSGADAAAVADFAYKMVIRDGAVTRSIVAPAEKLDRTKQYTVVSWLAHGNLNDERFLAQVDLNVSYAQWKAVFPSTIVAEVTEATEAGLKISATVDNIALRVAADVPDTGKDDQGVYTAIVEKDLVDELANGSDAAVVADFAYKMFITDGAVNRSIVAAADKLDRSKQYAVVSWLAHGNLNEDRFLAQADLKVSWAQWDAVFGIADKPTTLTVTPSATSVSDGHTVGLTAKLDAVAPVSGTEPAVVGKIQFFENGTAFGSAKEAKLGKDSRGNDLTSVSVTAESSEISDGDSTVYTAEFTPAEGANFITSASEPVTIVGTEATGPWSPEISVFVKQGDELAPYTGQTVYKGDELVVRGSGFDPEANVGGRGAPLPFGPQGTYVVFGNFDSTGWEPSEGAASSKRKVTNQGWLLAESVLNSVPPMYKNAVLAQWIEPTGGTFEWNSGPLTTPDQVKDGEFGIYTYAAGGAVNAAEELAVPINYVDTVRPGNPNIELFLSDGTTKYEGQELEDGDTLVVKGSGFDPYANVPASSEGGVPIPNTLPQGTFLVFGSFADEWQPSKGIEGDARVMNNQSRLWLLAEDTLDAVPTQYQNVIRGSWVELSVDGTFEAEITLKTPEVPLSDGNYGIYTYAGGAGQVVNAKQELAAEVNYNDGLGGEEQATGALQWGIKGSFVNYVTGAGSVDTIGAATRTGNIFNFPQIAGGEWNAASNTGDARFGGGVSFSAHGGALSISIADPVIEVTSDEDAVLSAKVDGTLQPLVNIDLSKATKTIAQDGSVTWTGAKTSLHEDSVDAFGQYDAGEVFDDITFTVGAESDAGTTDPVTPPPVTKPKPTPAPKPAQPSQQAGSLSWGVSSNFADYVTNPNRAGGKSGGRIDTSGVGKSGGAFLFPQATGGSWNKSTQTGTVRFSGVVTFYAHHGGINRSYANPVITVASATSGSISVNGATYSLNLGAGSKSVGSNGEVTWSNVPVNGSISGGGDGGGGSFTMDALSFTVGAASSIQYGSTTQTEQKVEREAAATPPTTDGIEVVTPEDELVPGGEIEIKASGFEANERDILVVLYSDPIVLDRKAGANESGDVRWIGTLPKDLEPGEHTITLQGSIDAGAVITVVDADEKSESIEDIAATTSGSAEAVSAEVAGPSSDSVWMWWIGAGALLLLAAAMGVLVVNQRRNAATGSDV